jgi:signal transduction histidine kinase
MSAPQPVSIDRPGATARPSLYAQVLWARIWLPLLIVAVVMIHQLLVVPMGGDTWRFWSQLLFYSLLGPLATYATLTWIAGEVRERERAQVELQRTFRELQDSYAVLGALQRVTEQFASAPDLEHAVAAATRGVREATGARAAAVVLGQGVAATDVDDADGLTPESLTNEARVRDTGIQQGTEAEVEAPLGDDVVISLAVRWGGHHEGSLHAVFREAPDAKQRETLRILAADFSAAAEAVRGRTRDLITLFDVDRTIRAEGNLDRLLGTLVSTLARRVGASSAGVYLRDDEDMLELRAAVRLDQGDEGSTAVPMRAAQPPLRLGEGPVGRAAMAGEPIVLPVLRADDRETGGPLLWRAGSAVFLPLVAEESVLGVIVLAHAGTARFAAERLPFLGVVASQVSLAVANAVAYRQSEELAIAEERTRIAREIHDGVAQSLAFSALKLDLVARLMTRDQGAAARELVEATATVREMIREIRRSIFALRPVDLERHGFVETLRRYALDFGQQNDVVVELDVAPLADLSMKSESVLFRIFQEAMHNVAKHASAARVWISVRRDAQGNVTVSVRDDGRGFDPAHAADRVTTAGGLGLRQMRERVEGRGGRFTIESRPGAGTTVTASLPS